MTNKSRTGAACGLLCVGLLSAGFTLRHAAAADDASPVAMHARHANFEKEHASHDARHVADWVVHAGDNNAGAGHAAGVRSLPFVIVDKKDAKVFVFDAQGQLLGAAAALLGQAPGDDAIPGIGDRALSSIRPGEKTTPAGRFVASLGESTRGEDVLWVDYAGAVSMHRVITSNLKERRAHRLASVSPLDNRMTYGCINIPKKFYESVVRPAFTGTYGIVYVLPETRSARDVFSSYGAGEAAR